LAGLPAPLLVRHLFGGLAGLSATFRRALFSNFFASPGFGFTEKNSTIPMEGGAFDKTNSNRYGPLRSLSVAKKDIYPLEVNALSFARGYGELHALFISQRSDWIMFYPPTQEAAGLPVDEC
jgi:hypothetical protein